MIDHRNISTGYEIPTETYSDQPYVVQTDDGAWLCAVTTGAGHEGQGGQHVVTMRSTDLGRTWSEPVDVEPADGPEASYAVLLEVPEGYLNAGRVYVLYNHNTDLASSARSPILNCVSLDVPHYLLRSDTSSRIWKPLIL